MIPTCCFFKEVNFHLRMLQVTMLVYAGGESRSYEVLWIVGDVLSLDLRSWPRGSYYFIYKDFPCLFVNYRPFSAPFIFSFPSVFIVFLFFSMLHLPIFLVFLLFPLSSVALNLFFLFGTTLTSQNSVYEEIKSRLTSGLLPKNINFKIYSTIIFLCCFVWVWILVAHIEGGT